MATPEDVAARDRIIKHMNADHSDSVRRYIEAFKQKSFYHVRNARMTDINLYDMKFDCGGQHYTIPFEPPMTSLREARGRVVELDKEALQALHRSDITVTKFIPPYVHPVHLFNFTVCTLTYIAFSRAANFLPGSLLYDTVLSGFPGFAHFCFTIQPLLLPAMVGIHALETGIMVAKLDRHGLTPLDGIWWAWAGSCFVEGITSFKRMDGLIRRRKKEKDAKKH